MRKGFDFARIVFLAVLDIDFDLALGRKRRLVANGIVDVIVAAFILKTIHAELGYFGALGLENTAALVLAPEELLPETQVDFVPARVLGDCQGHYGEDAVGRKVGGHHFVSENQFFKVATSRTQSPIVFQGH